jgi:hypothetical protein
MHTLSTWLGRVRLIFIDANIESKLRFRVQSKSLPYNRPRRSRGGVEVWLYSFVTSALEGGGWPVPLPGRFTSGKDPVPIGQEAGWAPERTCAKNLAPTEFRSPDRPARNQSLYRLSYPGPPSTKYFTLDYRGLPRPSTSNLDKQRSYPGWSCCGLPQPVQQNGQRV